MVLFCYAVLCVLSSFVFISLGKRELIALHYFLSWCLVMAVSVLCFFLMVPWVSLQCLIVAFLGNTQILFSMYTIPHNGNIHHSLCLRSLPQVLITAAIISRALRTCVMELRFNQISLHRPTKEGKTIRFKISCHTLLLMFFGGMGVVCVIVFAEQVYWAFYLLQNCCLYYYFMQRNVKFVGVSSKAILSLHLYSCGCWKRESFHMKKSHNNLHPVLQANYAMLLLNLDRLSSCTLLTCLLSLSFLKIMCTRQVFENNAPNSVVKPIHIIHTLICNRKKRVISCYY